MSKELADLLFPDVTMTPEDLEIRYPERALGEGAIITRIGPSPTGFVHLGNLYNAIIAERLAYQSGGLFYLRIEDTDNKREVHGAIETIISSMKFYGILFDEGVGLEGDYGNYGPYTQRQRKDIYQVYAKKLVEYGLAYPCFCSEEKLNNMRETQMQKKLDIGYYGEWAVCRNVKLEEIKKRIHHGDQYVLRFKSDAKSGETITVKDAIRGDLTMPKNTLDFILLKSDGIPTYHFAHVIDDHLMRTTHVVRGEDWIPSLPMHVQMFEALSWQQPVYCHTATLMKMDGTSKRKLSKRKDPELGLCFYQKEGYLPKAVWQYILTILNSNFEEWERENRNVSYLDFQFTTQKMSNSGALFDLNKLNDISKDIISRMTAEEIYLQWLMWADTWNTDYAVCLRKNKEVAINALRIGRSGDKIRKDLITWSQTCDFMRMYFEEFYQLEDEFPSNVSKEDRIQFITHYLQKLDFQDDKTVWFEKVKEITVQLGFADKMKEYKKNPDKYKGSIVELTNILRIAITGRINAPDIWEVCMIVGEKSVRERLNAVLI